MAARHVDIRERSTAWLPDHAAVSIAYVVRSVLDPVLDDGGLGGIALVERPVAAPWRKDHDALPGNHPADWAERFDLSRWGLLSAHRGTRHVGGAVIAFRAPGVDLHRDRDDLAVLWDLRIAPDARRTGVGATLLDAAERWAATRGARCLQIETQNVNVPACRFYAARGYELGAVHRFAYPELPDEIQLLWFKRLRAEH